MAAPTHDELLNSVFFPLRQLSQLDPQLPQAMEIADLWVTVRKVVESARVEHQRLLGMDVTEGEQHLRDTGWLPWRDLTDSSSSGETVELTTREVTDDAPIFTVELRFSGAPTHRERG